MSKYEILESCAFQRVKDKHVVLFASWSLHTFSIWLHMFANICIHSVKDT